MTPKIALSVSNMAHAMMLVIESVQDADPEVVRRFPMLSEIHKELDTIENDAATWGAELLADEVAAAPPTFPKLNRAGRLAWEAGYSAGLQKALEAVTGEHLQEPLDDTDESL